MQYSKIAQANKMQAVNTAKLLQNNIFKIRKSFSILYENFSEYLVFLGLLLCL